jgi:MFS superfamily sulfate permease-like transporter
MPLNLGVAVASGVPAYLGIVSGVIGALLVGGLSGAPLMVSGPDAGIGVLVLEMIHSHGIQKLGLIVFLAGLLQLILGALRGANWFRAISPAVVNGMLGGMGLMIVLTQFHIMLDDVPQKTGIDNLLMIPSAIQKGLIPVDGLSHHPAACIGSLTMIVALLWARFAKGSFKQVPAALIAIITASAVTAALKLPIQLITLPTNMLSGFDFLTVSKFLAGVNDSNMWISAATLAFVVTAQSLITATAVDNSAKNHRSKFDRELIAQGVGNMACGFLGALPVAGVLLRSMANLQSGATCKTANMMHGVLMVSTVLFFPAVLSFVPTSALAAILVLTGYRMVAGIYTNVKEYERTELAVFATTVLAILATNLFTGLIIGFALAVIKEMMAISHLGIKLNPMDSCGRMVLELWGPATFLQLPKITSTLEAVPAKAEVHVRLDELTYIDHACLELLMDWGHRYREQGGEFVIDWGPFEARRRSAHSRRRRPQPQPVVSVADMHSSPAKRNAV